MYRSAVAALKNDFIKPDEYTTVQELLNRYQDTIHHDGNGNLKATQYDMNNNKINSNLPVTDEDAATHLKIRRGFDKTDNMAINAAIQVTNTVKAYLNTNKTELAKIVTSTLCQ